MLKKIVEFQLKQEQLQEYFKLLGNSQDILVSLIVPIFNASETLKEHIKSLYLQSTLLPYEVIFVNNNSSDGSVEYLRELGANVINETRQGVNYARQAGLEVAKGEVILTMDPDTIYGTSYVDDMALPFFLNEQLVLVWNSPKSYKGEFEITATMAVKNHAKALLNKWNEIKGGLHVIKKVRAHGLALRTKAVLECGYNSELPQVPGCDDGILALTLFSRGKFLLVNTPLWTKHTKQRNNDLTKYPRNKAL